MFVVGRWQQKKPFAPAPENAAAAITTSLLPSFFYFSGSEAEAEEGATLMDYGTGARPGIIGNLECERDG